MLLWKSSIWRKGDKIFGTLLWLALLVGGLYFSGVSLVGPPVSLIFPILGLVVVAEPIFGTVRLTLVYHLAAQASASI